MPYHILFMFIAIVFSQSIFAVECPMPCDKAGACKRQLYIGSKKIDYYSNFPINVSNSCIDHIIFAVHGTERDAEGRYFTVLNAAKSINKQNHVLIISPFFKSSEDNPSSKDYYWTNSGWKQGDSSISNGPQVSSFAIADSIMSSVVASKLFPISRISVTGHSAGGQYTQLYALTTTLPNDIPLNYQFLVLNPSNYSYLSELRPHPETSGLYELPIYWNGNTWLMKPIYENAAGKCPRTYNDYKYGLNNRNLYASRLSTSQIINQYLIRKVYYFLGELDTDPNDSSLDTSCSAKLEGQNRLRRGQNFYYFLKQYFPVNVHEFGIVPGVGHSGSLMYNSTIVKTVLF